MIPNPNIAVYGGLFETDDSALAPLMNSGFTTAILWSIHVHGNGDLYYNDNLLVSGGVVNKGTGKGQINPNLPTDVSKLRTGGFGAILGSIGAGGPPEPKDFHHIQTLLGSTSGTKTLSTNFQAFAEWAGLDGFDFDCEEDGITHATIATLANMLAGFTQQGIITYAPYGVPSEQFWLETMSSILAQYGTQYVKWWNLQNYGGADPGSWIAAMTEYIKDNPTKPIGVSNPNAFMVTGVSSDLLPDGVQDQFAGWQGDQLKLQGGFIWNFTGIMGSGYAPANYAEAITNGLAGKSRARAARR